MSIKMLERMYQNYVNIPRAREHYTMAFMDTAITILKDLYKELDKKEDKIDINDIKEVKNING